MQPCDVEYVTVSCLGSCGSWVCYMRYSLCWLCVRQASSVNQVISAIAPMHFSLHIAMTSQSKLQMGTLAQPYTAQSE